MFGDSVRVSLYFEKGSKEEKLGIVPVIGHRSFVIRNWLVARGFKWERDF